MDRYEILEKIGDESAYATVYKAIEKKTKKIFVIKACDKGFDPELLKKEYQFLRELETCPHICQAHETFVCEEKTSFGVEKRWCMVMPFYEGGSLRQRIQLSKSRESLTGRGQKEDEQIILKWSKTILEGIIAVHELKLIHRDLKPENLFLDSNDEIKIGDFGIAKIGTLFGTVVGSAGYCAPEITPNREYDRSADLWSFGCILLDLLTLQTPRDVLGVSIEKRISSIPKFYSPKWESIVKSLLQDDPIKRCNEKSLKETLQSLYEETEKTMEDTEATFVEIPFEEFDAGLTWITEKSRTIKLAPPFITLQSHLEYVIPFRFFQPTLRSSAKIALQTMSSSLRTIQLILKNPMTKDKFFLASSGNTDFDIAYEKEKKAFEELQSGLAETCSGVDSRFFRFSPSAAIFWSTNHFKEEVSLLDFYSSLITTFSEDFKLDEKQNRIFMSCPISLVKRVISTEICMKESEQKDMINLLSLKEFLLGNANHIPESQKYRTKCYPFDVILRAAFARAASNERRIEPDSPAPDLPSSPPPAPHIPHRVSRGHGEHKVSPMSPFRTQEIDEDESKASELYEAGKAFLENSKWPEAYQAFRQYKEHLEAGRKTSKSPHDDKHLLYLSISFHEATKKGAFAQRIGTSGPRNVYIEQYYQWTAKYPPQELPKLPSYIARVFSKTKDTTSTTYGA